MTEGTGTYRAGGWTVTLIAIGVAAYWLARSGALSAAAAAMSGSGAAAVLLGARAVAARRAARRRELHARLAARMRQAAERGR